MTEQECYKLLGFGGAGNPATVMTIEVLTRAITDRIESDLIDSADRIREFTPVLMGAACMVLKKEDELLFLAVGDDGYLEVSEDTGFLFRVLSAEGLLREVAPDAVVTELERLREEVVAAKLRANEDREYAEFERLKAKFEATKLK